jgi:DNA-binding response OmpR family regulator
MICDCCRAILEHTVALPAEIRSGLPPQTRKLAEILWLNQGRLVHHDTIVSWLWKGAHTPDQPKRCYQVYATHLRPRFAAHGYRLAAEWGEGYRLVQLAE